MFIIVRKSGSAFKIWAKAGGFINDYESARKYKTKLGAERSITKMVQDGIWLDGEYDAVPIIE